MGTEDNSFDDNDGNNGGNIGDRAIVANLLLSLGVGLGLFLGYCLIRKLFRNVYSPNVWGTTRPRWPNARDGHFDWLRTTYATTDSQLLAMVGLEAYVFLQAMKLMAGILLAVAAPVVLLLLPAYAFTGTGQLDVYDGGEDAGDNNVGTNVFYRMSILNASPNFLWLPFVVSYMVALLVLYVVFLFYRNYVLLRQAFLKRPSALCGAVTLQRFMARTGNVADARRLIDVQTQAVLMTGVSHKYDRAALLRLLEETGMGPVDALTFVADRTPLTKLTRQRNRAIEAFERSCQQFFRHVVQHGAIQGLKKLQDIDEYLQQHVTLSPRTRDRLALLALLRDPTFHPEHRPKFKTEGREEDAISHHLDELERLDAELKQMLHENGLDSPLLNSNTQEEGAGERGELKKSFQERTTLVSLKKFTWLGHNLKDFRLTMWGTSMTAIVLFREPSKAAAVSQSLLSRQLFSMRSQRCPSPDDLLWDNLYVPAADRRLRNIAGNLMYVLWILLFANITAALTIVTDLDKLGTWLPFLKGLPPRLHSLIQGVMAPLAYNIALALAPIVLRAIGAYQGKGSKSEMAYSVLHKLCWFYFIQAFVVVMLARSVVDLVAFVAKRDWGPLLRAFRESLVSKSSFFFNFIVQKALLSTMVQLVRFDALFLALVKRMSALSWTARQYAANNAPTVFEFTDHYAQYGTFMLQVTLAFVMITPITVLPGLVYFVVAYGVFRHQLLYAYVTGHESGGLLWSRAGHQILFGLVISQLFTTAHFALRGSVWQAVGMLPLLAFTLLAMHFFQTAFDSKASFRPLCFELEQEVDKVIEDLERHQNQLIVESHTGTIKEDQGPEEAAPPQHYGDLSVASQIVEVPVNMLSTHVEDGTGDAQPRGEAGPSRSIADRGARTPDSVFHVDPACLQNPYKNPVLFRKHPSIILSPMFLGTLSYLCDKPPSSNEETVIVSKNGMDNLATGSK